MAKKARPQTTENGIQFRTPALGRISKNHLLYLVRHLENKIKSDQFFNAQTTCLRLSVNLDAKIGEIRATLKENS